MQEFDLIRQWATQKGIYEHSTVKEQTLKLGEEFGELCQAALKSSGEDLEDAIGDMVVVLTNIAHMHGTSLEACVVGAYNEIKDRTGKMKNGSFVKDK